MAIQEYAYSIQDDFVINHKVDPTILQDEIINSSIIITEIHHIYANLEMDECQVWFFDTLPQAEEDELDAIIAAHSGELAGGVTPGEIGDFESGQGDMMFGFGNDHDISWYKYDKDAWEPARRFIFRGTNELGIPVGIKAIVRSKDYVDAKESDFRLYDVTNGQAIFTWTNFKVNGWNIHTQKVSDTFPIDDAIFEIQGRKNGGELYISCFLIQFSGNVIDNIPTN